MQWDGCSLVNDTIQTHQTSLSSLHSARRATNHLSPCTAVTDLPPRIVELPCSFFASSDAIQRASKRGTIALVVAGIDRSIWLDNYPRREPVSSIRSRCLPLPLNLSIFSSFHWAYRHHSHGLLRHLQRRLAPVPRGIDDVWLLPGALGECALLRHLRPLQYRPAGHGRIL